MCVHKSKVHRESQGPHSQRYYGHQHAFAGRPDDGFAACDRARWIVWICADHETKSCASRSAHDTGVSPNRSFDDNVARFFLRQYLSTLFCLLRRSGLCGVLRGQQTNAATSHPHEEDKCNPRYHDYSVTWCLILEPERETVHHYESREKQQSSSSAIHKQRSWAGTDIRKPIRADGKCQQGDRDASPRIGMTHTWNRERFP